PALLQRVRGEAAEAGRRGRRGAGREGRAGRGAVQPSGSGDRPRRRPAGRGHRDHPRFRHPVPDGRPGGGPPRTSTMNTVGRPTAPVVADNDYRRPTLTGGRGLLQDEALIFELDGWDKTGVDLPEPELDGADLGDLARRDPIGLPGLSEPEAMRH